MIYRRNRNSISHGVSYEALATLTRHEPCSIDGHYLCWARDRALKLIFPLEKSWPKTSAEKWTFVSSLVTSRSVQAIWTFIAR